MKRAFLRSAGLLTMSTTLLNAESVLQFRQLPSLPDPIGFAGSYAGVSSGNLVVAGGANFPDGMPWDGGTKAWYDTVYTLEDGQWKAVGKLTVASGYGVSLTTAQGVLCIGGSDQREHLTNVFYLNVRKSRARFTWLPPLPMPLAYAAGACIGDVVYMAGGTESPTATNAVRHFLALDLSRLSSGWAHLESWPGAARMLSTAAAANGCFYLFGGTSLSPDAAGQPQRTYLRDAYAYKPGQGWRRLADMPNAAVAAPTPAAVLSDGSVAIVGGDDGTMANFQPRSRHPGFPKRTLIYTPDTDRWRTAEAPVSRATLPGVSWGGQYVMISGEARPGLRSPEIWALKENLQQ